MTRDDLISIVAVVAGVAITSFLSLALAVELLARW
jgi:hypothetical protein